SAQFLCSSMNSIVLEVEDAPDVARFVTSRLMRASDCSIVTSYLADRIKVCSIKMDRKRAPMGALELIYSRL
ncbi:MAG: hypothetical protein CMI12_16480, partial [Oceanospirillum sp.]|nr:hypothetical protein [Oceanospirillum sp.]